jgi:alginate O-acetyltransferase complex protein AlgI
MCWRPEYIILILLSTVTDYFCGNYIGRSVAKSTKKVLLLISLLINLGLLFLFKYYNFIFDSFVSAFDLLGFRIQSRTLDLLLPVGISFYTFQTLAYTIDVYREKIKPEKNVVKFALYVAFFPQLVAGPIERAQNLLPQLNLKTKLNLENFVIGFRLILWGFFKKLVVADNLAHIVDQVYNNPAQQNGLTYFIATILFAFQIYCDFSGYSDIAIGSARLIGVKLMTNFNVPYIASSIKEFWARWHISLSTWFRDYLYIPLGGNRVHKKRIMFNLFVVFVVSGLWHGANWTFVVWGAIHGTVLIIENLLRPTQKFNIPKIFKQVFIFLIVSVSWVFFRAVNVSQAFDVLLHFMSTPSLLKVYFDGNAILNGFGDISILVIVKAIIITIVFFIFDVILQKEYFIKAFKSSAILRMVIYFILLYGIVFLGYFGETAFIYFQF